MNTTRSEPQPPGTGGHGEQLSRRREEVLAALLGARTLKEAAERIGCHERTLRRWLKEDDELAVAYREAKAALVEEGTDRLLASMTKAAETLTAIAENAEFTAAARVAACKAILDGGLKAHELNELAARIEKLEEALAARRSH